MSVMIYSNNKTFVIMIINSRVKINYKSKYRRNKK